MGLAASSTHPLSTMRQVSQSVQLNPTDMAILTTEKIQPWKVYAESAPHKDIKIGGYWYPEPKGRALTLARGDALPNFKKAESRL